MNPISRWLNNTPIINAVDRRNAPFLQILLLFFGIFVPLNKAVFLYAIYSGAWQKPGPLQLYADLATDILLVASAWIALRLIRRGVFHKGVTLFLAVTALCVGIAYASVGLAHIRPDPIPLLLLSLAGLVIGRRALWLMLASLTAMLLACLVLDVFRASAIAPAASIGKAISIAGIWLIITVVLDRTVAALRISLQESEKRGQALEQSNWQLREEIAERERTQVQLIHSQKMDAAGRLASGLAHDFNNVLVIILGYAQQRNQLASDGGIPALASTLEGIEMATRRAMAISRKLLNFSRLEIARPETFDACEATHELQSMLRQLLGSRIRLQLDIPQRPISIHMDRNHFELAILNIAGNSRDAMPETGTLRISASVAPAGKSFALTLSDDGAGMPEPVQLRAFDPFFTTKPTGEGTGLGLSVVKDIVTTAGGSISLECPPAGGTTIRIELPLASPAADSHEPTSATSDIVYPE
ncbi:ATP-binding protein [uncultured Stenotrophomonas sp.]|uniref:sensor histidine kinase n=1 Tax=uncultured Stenotrophomonas sp. TaxID=165438 RepID=UPI0025FE1C16|nr:ATP-binding protein [uncultured Stenotrophomonas sp.]